MPDAQSPVKNDEGEELIPTTSKEVSKTATSDHIIILAIAFLFIMRTSSP